MPISNERDVIMEIKKKIKADMPDRIEKVLVVDDEPYLAESQKRWIKRLGYDVRMATDPNTALEIIRQGGVDVLITDLNMPAMRGNELIKKARLITPKIHCIIMSGFGAKTEMDQIGNDLNCCVIAKPYSITEMGRIIRKTIDDT